MEFSYTQPIKGYRMSDQPEKRQPTQNDKNPSGTVASSPEKSSPPSQKPGANKGGDAEGSVQQPASAAPDPQQSAKPTPDQESAPANTAASRPAASATITCGVCGFKNRPGVFFCEHCDTALTTGENMISTKKLDSGDPAVSAAILAAAMGTSASTDAKEPNIVPTEVPPIKPAAPEKPADITESLDKKSSDPNNDPYRNLPGTADLSQENLASEPAKGPIPAPVQPDPPAPPPAPPKPPLDIAAIMSAPAMGSDIFEKNMVLRLEVEGATTPILVYPRAETRIGRRDPATGTMPDVDLTAFAGYRMGVSRNHCLIKLRDQRLEVHDLGSSNGTMLNGTRLDSHRPVNLRNGDELVLGKMVIRVTFQRRN